MIAETAYAKINLALHVRGRREDGYHEIETLFAFVDQGDRLTADEAVEDSLKIDGEFAEELTDPSENIVFRALAVLPRADGMVITLDKRLPVAAGLGGGSADAGAVFRLIERSHGLPDDWSERAAHLGADVPACVESITCIGRGTGTDLEPVTSDLVNTSVLLVNPRILLATGPVFAAWDGVDRGPLTGGAVSQIALSGRNDLEAPAMSLCPQVREVLAVLGETDAFLTRMSGSGATCYALFRSHDVMLDAMRYIESNYPEWWKISGKLR